MISPWLIRSFILFGYFAFFFTGLVNIGFVALDDYTDTINLSIPAQKHSFSSGISDTPEIRSLFPAITLISITKAAFHLGLKNPVHQLQFLLIFLGFLNFTVFWIVVNKTFKDDKKLILFILGTLGLYFLAPFLFTRAMIENLAAPFVFLSAFFALSADRKKNVNHLILASLFLFLSACYRNQTLAVLPVLFLIAITFSNRKKSLILLTLGSSIFFILTGLPDLIYRGGWHSSFFKYFVYNFQFSSTYGKTPFYAYPVLFLFLSWFPLSFSKKAYAATWQKLKPFRALTGYFIFFVLCHSLIAHKEERFMIPILPIFFVLVSFLWRELNKVQFFIIFCFNFCLLFLTSLSISQNNIVGPTLYLSRHPQFKKIASVDQSLLFIPEAYLLNPPQFISLSMEEADKIKTCDTAFAVTRERFIEVQEKWRYLGIFKPGPLEQLLIRLNPGQNRRRQGIYLFANPDCVSVKD